MYEYPSIRRPRYVPGGERPIPSAGGMGITMPGSNLPGSLSYRQPASKASAQAASATEQEETVVVDEQAPMVTGAEDQPSFPYTGARPDQYIPYSATRDFPYAIVDVTVDNIRCRCYEGAPREQMTFESLPYAMEVHTWGTDYVCKCDARPDRRGCPPEVSQGASPNDPFWQRHCTEWQQGQAFVNAAMMSDQGFRQRLSERVVQVAGATGLSKMGVKAAEFTSVLQEREARALPIKIMAPIVVAAAGGFLVWRYFKKRKVKK